jgi:hypothetical protein
MSPAAFLKGQQKGSPVSYTAEVSESLLTQWFDATTAFGEWQAGILETDLELSPLTTRMVFWGRVMLLPRTL